MDSYEVTLALIGVAALAAAWLPKVLENRPLSPLLVTVAIGAAVFAAPIGVDLPDPFQNRAILEHVTEAGVLIALMGAGLKIDRRVGLRSWGTTWRLLLIAMPLFIAFGALLGGSLLGLAPASALLLSSSLAPTDPVLAGDVQVGEPGAEEEDVVRFTLTSEAGLNDALAFPFVYAALAMTEHGANPANWLAEWVAVELLAKLAIGLAVGLVAGRFLGYLAFRVPIGGRYIADTTGGFVVVAAMFTVYGVTELLYGYGFLGVFVAAAALRDYERDHEYHRTLHGFAEQVEQLFTIGLLVAFGGALVEGLLEFVDWRSVVFAAVLLLVIRPVTALFSLGRAEGERIERRAIAFYGIRGVGSFYYLAYATTTGDFPDAQRLWSIVALVVLGSLVIHGTSAGPVMTALDKRRTHRSRAWRRRESGPVTMAT